MLTQYGNRDNKYVYLLTNDRNGKTYVGSSLNPKCRYEKHIQALKRGDHPVKELQNDFNKYGVNAFSFHIVGLVTEYSTKSEEYQWMKVLQTYDKNRGYNYQDPVMKKTLRKEAAWVSA